MLIHGRLTGARQAVFVGSGEQNHVDISPSLLVGHGGTDPLALLELLLLLLVDALGGRDILFTARIVGTQMGIQCFGVGEGIATAGTGILGQPVDTVKVFSRPCISMHLRPNPFPTKLTSSDGLSSTAE